MKEGREKRGKGGRTAREHCKTLHKREKDVRMIMKQLRKVGLGIVKSVSYEKALGE